MSRSYTLLKLVPFLLLFSCALLSQKSDETENASAPVNPVATAVSTEKPDQVTTQETLDAKLSDAELQKYAYELGLDPKGKLSEDDMVQIAKRRKVRRLERRLDSQKERLNYSKVVPWLENDD